MTYFYHGDGIIQKTTSTGWLEGAFTFCDRRFVVRAFPTTNPGLRQVRLFREAPSGGAVDPALADLLGADACWERVLEVVRALAESEEVRP